MGAKERKKDTTTGRPNDDIIDLGWKNECNTRKEEVYLTYASQRKDEAAHHAGNTILINSDDRDNVHQKRAEKGDG